ncbi:hypothetical protein GCM10023219_07530 [Stakelama sediminis]|uniref:Outer membrane biosynthesis protein TonB n=1 Tax=Stakelama sediminis TaxID=463200 RepID=A0A840YVB4_9SPHN|nr:cell envelope biogenesis protein TolA [Stakelama sediminis]MBB5717474.1 outer membrane biosynthesis protein TonB [Stakelama sediminis]
MTRRDSFALSGSALGHVAVFALLSLSFLHAEKPVDVTPPIDVSLVSDVAMKSQSPNLTAPPAAASAPDLGQMSKAPPPIPAPEQPRVAAPTPEKKSAPAPKPADKPAPEKPKPAPKKPEKAKSAATPEKTASSKKKTEEKTAAKGPKIDKAFERSMAAIGKGSADAPRAAELGDAIIADLSSVIQRQVQPCANRLTSPGPGANEISSRLRIQMNRDGSLAARPELRGQTGITAENRRYAQRVAELAKGAFIACAPYHLPDKYYDVGGRGWKDIILTYKLPG